MHDDEYVENYVSVDLTESIPAPMSGLRLGVPIRVFGSSPMSMGARLEQVLASRLVALERLVFDTPTPELWQEFYTCADLWLRCRAPVPTTPPITQAMLKARFAQKSDSRRSKTESDDRPQ
jgi:hypothetical protein